MHVLFFFVFFTKFLQPGGDNNQMRSVEQYKISFILVCLIIFMIHMYLLLLTRYKGDLLLALSQPEPRPQKIDQLVIDGHVLPDQVLFTAPTPDNTPYRTLVFSDNLKVTVSFLHAHSKGDDSNILRYEAFKNTFSYLSCNAGNSSSRELNRDDTVTAGKNS